MVGSSSSSNSWRGSGGANGALRRSRPADRILPHRFSSLDGRERGRRLIACSTISSYAGLDGAASASTVPQDGQSLGPAPDVSSVNLPDRGRGLFSNAELPRVKTVPLPARSCQRAEENGSRNNVAGLPSSDQSFAGLRMTGEGEGRCAPLGSGASLGARVSQTLSLPESPNLPRSLSQSLASGAFSRRFPGRAGCVHSTGSISSIKAAGLACKASPQFHQE